MDEYTQAHNELNNATDALTRLVYGPGFDYLALEEQTAVKRALEVLEDHGVVVEPESPLCVVDGCTETAPDRPLCAGHRSELEEHPERFA